MASSGCWKCLARPSLTAASPLTRNALPPVLLGTTSASFTTTAAAAKNPLAAKVKKGGQGAQPPARGSKTLRIKKKLPPKPTGRPPAPGERKAIRKRIVLSNTNALEVPGLVDLSDKILLDQAYMTRVVGIPGTVVDQLRAVEAFKPTQSWELFRRPALLIRKESLEVSKLLEEAAAKNGTARLILDGSRGTGKSLMLLHSMANAFLKGWVVINIPEAQELTTAVTDYAPVEGTPLFSQNTYTANLLSQISKANATVLSSIEVTQQHTLPIPIPPKTTLARLAELGARDPEISWPIFKALWSELTAPGRPPVLMTVDSLSHIMRESDYRNPEFELIHSHDLTLVNHFINYFSGSAELPNGGAFIGAMSRSHAPASKALDLAIGQKTDVQDGKQPRAKDPFTKYDERVFSSLQKASLMRLNGLSKEEAMGLMEYWAASGLLRSKVDEKTVTEKWALSGNGVVGEIERGALRMRI